MTNINDYTHCILLCNGDKTEKNCIIDKFLL